MAHARGETRTAQRSSSLPSSAVCCCCCPPLPCGQHDTSRRGVSPLLALPPYGATTITTKMCCGGHFGRREHFRCEYTTVNAATGVFTVVRWPWAVVPSRACAGEGQCDGARAAWRRASCTRIIREGSERKCCLRQAGGAHTCILAAATKVMLLREVMLLVERPARSALASGGASPSRCYDVRARRVVGRPPRLALRSCETRAARRDQKDPTESSPRVASRRRVECARVASSSAAGGAEGAEQEGAARRWRRVRWINKRGGGAG